MPSLSPLVSLREFGELLTSWPVRLGSWIVLLGVTGLLVRAEALRADLPAGVRLTADLVYREAGGHRQRLDVYRPEGEPPIPGYPVLLAIHGGGWQGGGKGEYGRSLVRLVREGIALVAIDYQLARPGSPSWPENLDDVRGALEWVQTHSSEYQLNPDRVALIGASAGGHLALLAGYPPQTVTDWEDSRKPSGSGAKVKAVVDFYGPTDLVRLHETSKGAAGPVEGLTGGPPESRPAMYREASPVRQIREGGPPVMILHGTEDYLVPIEQSMELARALEEAGVDHRFVVVRGARHGFGLHAETRDFVLDLLEFLRRAWED